MPQAPTLFALALLAHGLLEPAAVQTAPGGPVWRVGGNGNGNGNAGSNNGNGNQTNGNGNFGRGNGRGNGSAPRT